MSSSMAFCLAFISVLTASFAQILLKKSALNKHDSFASEYLNRNVIIGYCLLGVSTIFTVFALTVLTIQDIAMIETTSYLMVMLSGRIFLKERITKGKVIGNLLILCGILLFYM